MQDGKAKTTPLSSITGTDEKKTVEWGQIESDSSPGTKAAKPKKGKGRRKAWEPPDHVRGALGDVVSILFRLQKGERKWVLNEIIDALCDTKVPNKGDSVKAAVSKAAQSNAPLQQKSEWKTKWHASAEYQSWQASFKKNPTPEEAKEYEEKREACFLVKEELRKKP